MRKFALTGDQRDSLRGAGVVIPMGKHRNLRVLTHPRHAKQDRTILVTRNGITWRRSAKLGAIGRTKTVRQPAPKRTQFAIGATYGESWQSKGAADTADTGTREYWFRGIRFESQLAIEAYIAELG